MNTQCRSNVVRGLLGFHDYGTLDPVMVHLEFLPVLGGGPFVNADEDVPTSSGTRRIDAVVCGALDLTTGERVVVHGGATELVSDRRWQSAW